MCDLLSLDLPCEGDDKWKLENSMSVIRFCRFKKTSLRAGIRFGERESLFEEGKPSDVCQNDELSHSKDDPLDISSKLNLIPKCN